MKPKLKAYKNGLRYLAIPMEEQRTATVLVLVEAGSKYETKAKNGISHFLEHMCFKGTAHRPNSDMISTELDGLGAEYNAFTGQEYTGYYAKVAAKHVAHALDLVSDIYLNPLFNENEIEKEKGVIVGEIDMRNDMLPSRASELFLELLYGNQPAGWPIAGPKELVTTFSRKDFLKYRSAHYVPSATVVVIAGKFNEKSTEQFVRDSFGHLKPSPKSAKKKVRDTQASPKVFVQHKASDQTHIILGFRGLPLKHELLPVANVLGAVLGAGMSSRLFRKMRGELGLGYYTHASHDAYTDHGIFAAAAGVDNARLDEAIKVIIGEFRRLRYELVGETELRKVKDMLSGRLMLGLESSDELAEFYGSQEILKKLQLSPEQALRRIESVDAHDLQKLANKLFISTHANLVILGPHKEKSAYTKFLEV